MPTVVRFDHIYGVGFPARSISHLALILCEALTLMEQIEQLVEKFESLKEKERTEAASILKKYAEGETNLEEVHYTLLDEGLIPMPARCTMYNKPKHNPEAEEAIKSLINEKILGP